MGAQDCVFCKIVGGEIPARKEYEDDDVVVFHDIHPQASTHLLIVPKEHISEFARLSDFGVWTKMAKVAQELIGNLGLKGYRLVNNGGEAALIDHLHLHLLGGVEKTRKV